MAATHASRITRLEGRLDRIEALLLARLEGDRPAVEVTPQAPATVVLAGKAVPADMPIRHNGHPTTAGEYVAYNARRTAEDKARKAKARRAVKNAPVQRVSASVTKAHMTKAQQGRKSWNDTFSAQARLSGLRFGPEQVSLYRASMDRWSDVSEARDEGKTPSEAIDLVIALVKEDLFSA